MHRIRVWVAGAAVGALLSGVMGCPMNGTGDGDGNGSGSPAGRLTVDAGDDVRIAMGQAIRLQAIAGGGDGTYAFSWAPSAGLDDAAAGGPLASPGATTTYTVTVTDGSGATASDEVTVEVVQPVGPTADAGPDQLVGDTDGDGAEVVTLDGTGSADPAGAALSFRWLLGDQEIATGAMPMVTLGVGMHDITLEATSDGGSVATDTVVITVASSGVLSADAGEDQMVRDGDDDGAVTVALDGGGSASPAGGVLEYRWLLEGDEIATGASPTVSLGIGTHEITLQVSAGGSTASDRVVITVLGPLTPPSAMTASASVFAVDDDDNGRQAVALSAEGSVDPDGQIVSYRWLADGVEVATGSEVEVEFDVGTRDVTLEVTDNDGLTASVSVEVSVFAPLTVNGGSDILADAAVNGMTYTGGAATLSATVGGGSGDTTIAWAEDGVLVAMGPQPTINFTIGFHTLTVRVGDLVSGRTAEDAVNVTIAIPSDPPASNRVPFGTACGQTVTDCTTVFPDAAFTVQAGADQTVNVETVEVTNSDTGQTFDVEQITVTGAAGAGPELVRFANLSTPGELPDGNNTPDQLTAFEWTQGGQGFETPEAVDGAAFPDAGPVISTEPSPQIAFQQGSRIVRLRVENTQGNISQVERIIRVNP